MWVQGGVESEGGVGFWVHVDGLVGEGVFVD